MQKKIFAYYIFIVLSVLFFVVPSFAVADTIDKSFEGGGYGQTVSLDKWLECPSGYVIGGVYSTSHSIDDKHLMKIRCISFDGLISGTKYTVNTPFVKDNQVRCNYPLNYSSATNVNWGFNNDGSGLSGTCNLWGVCGDDALATGIYAANCPAGQDAYVECDSQPCGNRYLTQIRCQKITGGKRSNRVDMVVPDRGGGYGWSICPAGKALQGACVQYFHDNNKTTKRVACVDLQPPPSPAPGPFSITSGGSSSCPAPINNTIRWSASNGATGYYIYYCTGAGCTPWDFLTFTNKLQYTSRVLQNITVRYQVYAENSTGRTASGNIYEITTPACSVTPPSCRIDAPASMNPDEQFQTSAGKDIKVYTTFGTPSAQFRSVWTNDANYDPIRLPPGGGFIGPLTKTLAGPASDALVQTWDGGAYKKAGDKPTEVKVTITDSNSFSYTCTREIALGVGSQPPPSPPTSVSVSGGTCPNNTRISVSWSGGGPKYNVERGLKLTSGNWSWTRIRTNTTSTNLNDIVPGAGRTYKYRVRGSNGTVQSGLVSSDPIISAATCNQRPTVTIDQPKGTNPPGGVITTGFANYEFKWTFSDPEDGFMQKSRRLYLIETDQCTSWSKNCRNKTRGFTVVGGNGVSVETQVLDKQITLQPNTNYKWKIVGCDSDGLCSSKVANFSTSPGESTIIIFKRLPDGTKFRQQEYPNAPAIYENSIGGPEVVARNKAKKTLLKQPIGDYTFVSGISPSEYSVRWSDGYTTGKCTGTFTDSNIASITTTDKGLHYVCFEYTLVAQTATFGITATGNTLKEVFPGGSAVFDFEIESLNDFAGTIDLSAVGDAAEDVTIGSIPSVTLATGEKRSFQVRVNTADNTSTKDYQIAVAGVDRNDAGNTAQTSATLRVWDFDVNDISPSILDVNRGQSANYSPTNIRSRNNFNRSLDVSVSIEGSKVNVSVPSAVTPTDTVTIQAVADSDAPTGNIHNVTLTVTHNASGRSKSKTAQLRVVQTAYLEVVPASPPPINVGQAQQFQAKYHASDGAVSTVTSDAVWASSDAAIATVSDSAPNKGEAIGVDKGSAQITATYNGETGTANLTVAEIIGSFTFRHEDNVRIDFSPGSYSYSTDSLLYLKEDPPGGSYNENITITLERDPVSGRFRIERDIDNDNNTYESDGIQINPTDLPSFLPLYNGASRTNQQFTVARDYPVVLFSARVSTNSVPGRYILFLEAHNPDDSIVKKERVILVVGRDTPGFEEI